MTVKFFDLLQMIAELKTEHVKVVRVQGVRYKIPVEYRDGSGKSTATIPHLVFEIMVTAKVKNEIWEYINRTDTTSEFDERRRINRAVKHTEEIEQGMTKKLADSGFDVRKGVFKEGCK